ncbi:MAG: hypothetical protein ACREVC_14730 [Burkholderiales bacterium]
MTSWPPRFSILRKEEALDPARARQRTVNRLRLFLGGVALAFYLESFIAFLDPGGLHTAYLDWLLRLGSELIGPLGDGILLFAVGTVLVLAALVI